MKRKVSICTLCASSAQGAADYLEQKLRGYNPSASSADFSDAASFADAVGKCACDGGIIVAAAPLSMFLNAKLRLLKLFSSKITRNSAILSAMGGNAPENPKEKDLQSAIPEKSKVFVSGDGLYSAFAKEFGEGIVVFMPLDKSRSDEVFALGLGAILQRAFPNAAKPKKAGLSQVKESVKKVIASGKTVAVAPCGSAKALLSVITAVPDSDDAFVPDSTERKQLKDESIEDHIAQSARLSKKTAETDLGISISDILTDENGEEYVMVCVADSERAKAARVFAVAGEERKHLIAASVIKLCEMLEELSGPAGLVNPNPPQPQKVPKKHIIFAIAAVAVAIVACLIAALILGGKHADASVANANANVNTNIIYKDAEPETTLADEEVFEYFGGSGLEDADMEAVAITEAETTALFSSSTKALTTTRAATAKVTEKVTKIITTVAQTVTTAKAAVTKATTTEKAATTTTKLTTTEPETTAQPTTESETTTGSTSRSGTFKFKVYGYGHGVGMSQNGAIAMAKSGSGYKEILTHYYPGTTVKTDSSTPATVNYGGEDIPIVEYLCKTTKKEIGAGAPAEALKAQIVAAYTYAKHSNFVVKANQHVYDSGYSYKGTAIHSACLAVLGMKSESDTPAADYVDYNGSAAFTCYFSTAAGQTASASSVWGSDIYPYLKGGVSSPEDPGASEFEISSDEMKELIKNYNSDIKLSDNPAEWLEVVSHDGSRGENCGYVTTMRVGGHTMKGNAFRASVMKYKIRSHCFTVEYIPA